MQFSSQHELSQPPADMSDLRASTRSHPRTLAYPLRSRVPTLGRRFLAWVLEVGILTGSITVPLYLGGKLNAWVDTPTANLTPPVQSAQQAIARALGISPRSLPHKVAPLTNFLWSLSLGLPLLLASAHIYSIGRWGRSWPKACLGLQVMALNGQFPGLPRALLREGVGKWGLPLGVAYGVWRLSGAFPSVGVLGGVALLALVGESLSALGNRPGRAWHDVLAGTCTLDPETGAIVHLASFWEAEAASAGRLPSLEAGGGIISVVFSPETDWITQPSRLGLGLGLLLGLGSLAGVGSYFVWSNHSPASNDETLYVNLVSTLTNPELDAAARRSAVLALGNLPDDRVTPLLVDLIAQTEDPLWLDALQQALVARGSEAFPPLQRLNQSLAADLAMQVDPMLHRTRIIRLQTVNRILTKLLLLEGRSRPAKLDLSRLNLGYLPDSDGDFRLILKHQDLAGINWQGSVLTQAQFQGVQFFHPGPDNHADTYDDRTTDFSGADLTDANLTDANLTLSRLVNTGLLRTQLIRANLTLANLQGANLEQARLIQANLHQSNLTEARLSNADLTQAQLSEANLESARLSEVNAAGANFAQANLQGISAQAANFTDSDLSHAQLEHADFTGAKLTGANLQHASLQNATLRDADLRDVWLQGAVLTEADFAGAILANPTAIPAESFVESVPTQANGAQFTGVDFSQVRNLDAEQLTVICARGGLHPACAPTPPRESAPQ